MTSAYFCLTCGAANTEKHTHCFACGRSLPEQADVRVASHETLLHGRYRLGATLGLGGYSSVFRGWDTQQDAREIAVKQINLRGLSAEETIEATNTYNRESEALSTLNHPQVPHLYDHFADPNHWYLVLEYIQGQTLETFLNAREALHKPLSFDEILAIMLQLCTVLEYLHTRKPPLIFRDLKPSNIMRAPEGKLYLIDFGIARRYTPGQSRDTQSLGSPGYAAPEQYGRAQTDARADIYSLGSLLRQLLTGYDPSEEAIGLLSSRLSGQPGNAELESLSARMLAPDPQNRPRSLFHVARELERIRQIQSASQQAASIWQPPTPQDYTPVTAAAAFAGAQVYLQHATFAQPGLGAACKSAASATSKSSRSAKLTRRRVLLGLGISVVAVTVGVVIKIEQNAQPGQTIYTYRGHSGTVNSVSWSFDSQRVASASSDQSVQAWDALNGNAPIIRGSYGNVVNSVSYSRSNEYATGSADTSLQIWSTSGNLLFNRTQVGAVNSVAWSPDGAYLACADAIVSIWNLSQQTSTSPALVESESGINYVAVAWSPNGQYLASSSSATTIVRAWLTSDMTTIDDYTGHTETITCIAWSPDSRRIAAGAGDSQVLLWDASSGQLLATYDIPDGAILAIAWSPDGQYIASASDDGVVRIWSTSDDSIVVTYTSHTGPVRAVAWSPDGQYIASGGEDTTVQVWKAP